MSLICGPPSDFVHLPQQAPCTWSATQSMMHHIGEVPFGWISTTSCSLHLIVAQKLKGNKAADAAKSILIFVQIWSEMWWSGTMRADICGSSMITPTKEREKGHTLLQDGRPWSYLLWEIFTKLPLCNIQRGGKEGHIQGTFIQKQVWQSMPMYTITVTVAIAGQVIGF